MWKFATAVVPVIVSVSIVFATLTTAPAVFCKLPTELVADTPVIGGVVVAVNVVVPTAVVACNPEISSCILALALATTVPTDITPTFVATAITTLGPVDVPKDAKGACANALNPNI